MPVPTTNLLLDLHADAGVTAVGGLVSAWLPQAGSVTDPATESSDDSKPLYRTDDGNNCLVFPQTQIRRLALPAGISFDQANFSVWVVAAFTTTSQCCLLSGTGWAHDVFGTRNKGGSGDNGGTGPAVMHSTGSFGSSLFVPVNKGIFGCVGGGSGAVFHSAGASENVAAPFAWVSGPGGWLGTSSDGANNPFEGRIYRVLIYGAEQSSGDVAATKAALIADHGIVTSYAKRLIFLGDSQTFGTGSTEGRNYTYRLAAMKATWEIYNFGHPGAAIPQISSEAEDQLPDLYDAAKRDEIVIFAGTNDFASVSSAVAFSRLQTMCGTVAGIADWDRISVCTVPMHNGAVDYNVLVRAGDPSYQNIIDFGVGSPIENRLDDNTNLTYFLPDGTHQTDAGQQVEADHIIADFPNDSSSVTSVTVSPFGFGFGF